MTSSDRYTLVQLLQDFTQASDRFVEATASHNSMHRRDLSALSTLMKNERNGLKLSPSQLSALLQLSSPATTAMLDRLERLGYIQRQRRQEDRRGTIINLTEKAFIEGRSMFLPLSQRLTDVIESYDDQRICQINEFLSQAIKAVDAAHAEGQGQDA
ncbi:MarR family transcriptional regulator [Glutamicibacter sp.]|uniref:MarR family transcriptional regulator n=1 Tax=Glutamicibacter sp. TaxID=1931995 RepID=UPI0028BD60C1|nr:MarR family transcriptional regulator [Glutamicibacter sp.]